MGRGKWQSYMLCLNGLSMLMRQQIFRRRLSNSVRDRVQKVVMVDLSKSASDLGLGLTRFHVTQDLVVWHPVRSTPVKEGLPSKEK